MYIIFLLIILYYQINRYLFIDSIFKHTSSKRKIINKNKKIIMILIYQENDNIKECLDSLLNQTIKPNEIIIFGKNLKINKSKVKLHKTNFNYYHYNKLKEKYSDYLIGFYRTNNIFKKNSLEKISNYMNRYSIGKLFVIHDVITNNKFIEKFNFYGQLNNFTNCIEYDFFVNTKYKKTSILKSFLITKIYNQNILQYCFHGNIYENFLFIIKILVYSIYPSLIVFHFISHLSVQIIIIYKYINYNQALEVDLKNVIIGYLLYFLRNNLPKVRLNLNKTKINCNSSVNKPKLKLINKVSNGIYYQVENSNLKIIHLYGDDYMKGYAYGQLCKKDFLIMLKKVEQLYKSIKPPNILYNEWKTKHDVKNLLLTIYKKINVNKNHINMIKGISDGSKIEFDDIIIITMLPELYHQHCMLLSYISKKENIFIRTLDYFFYLDTHILRVYHNEKSNSYCELGIPGTIWSITSVSEKLLCLGETSGSLDTINNNNGTPFYLYFKDLMENCNSIDDVNIYLRKIKKNENIFIMISSLLENKVNLIESESLKNYNFENFNEYLKLHGKGKIDTCKNNKTIFEYTDPEILNNILENYDDFSINNIKNSILKLIRTGGNHIMIVNNNFELYIFVNNKGLAAFDTTEFYFNINELFNHK